MGYYTDFVQRHKPRATKLLPCWLQRLNASEQMGKGDNLVNKYTRAGLYEVLFHVFCFCYFAIALLKMLVSFNIYFVIRICEI